MKDTHPYTKLITKGDYYELPDSYPFKGTPCTTRHTGDFRVLKKAHQRKWKVCLLCKRRPATVYMMHIDTSGGRDKTHNSCEKCVISFFQNYLNINKVKNTK